MLQPIIFIDWPDKSGKSSLAKVLQEHLALAYFKDRSKLVEENFESNAFAADEKRQILPACFNIYDVITRYEQWIVFDRWIATEYVYWTAFRELSEYYRTKILDIDAYYASKDLNSRMMNIFCIPNVEDAIKRCSESDEKTTASVWIDDKEVANKIWLLVNWYDEYAEKTKMFTVIFDWRTNTVYSKWWSEEDKEFFKKYKKAYNITFTNAIDSWVFEFVIEVMTSIIIWLTKARLKR